MHWRFSVGCNMQIRGDMMMETFQGFDITKTDNGLNISFTTRELLIFSKMLLSAKFPPDYVYSTNYLLNPHLNQLIDAISARLSEVHSVSENAYVIPQSDPFVQAVFKAIDDHIEHYKIAPSDRNKLLKTAFKPHRVEGFT